jgi:hypothetical protein
MKRVHCSIDGDPLPIGLLESGSASPQAAMSAFVAERFRPPRVRAAPPTRSCCRRSDSPVARACRSSRPDVDLAPFPLVLRSRGWMGRAGRRLEGPSEATTFPSAILSDDHRAQTEECSGALPGPHGLTRRAPSARTLLPARPEEPGGVGLLDGSVSRACPP